MRVRYVTAYPAAYGWCDHCDELTEFFVEGGEKNVGTKRLCKVHAQELMESLEKALFRERVVTWKKDQNNPKRSG